MPKLTECSTGMAGKQPYLAAAGEFGERYVNGRKNNGYPGRISFVRVAGAY